MKIQTRLPALLCAVCILLTACGAPRPQSGQSSTGPAATADQTAGSTGQTWPTESSAPAETQPDTQPGMQTEPTEPAQTDPVQTLPQQTEPTTQDPVIQGPQPTVPLPGEEEGTGVQILATGKQRVTYIINISSVQYVTSAAQLPDYDALAGYDDAWFAEHALVVVLETVSSGTAQVDIGSIAVSEGVAAVNLTHQAQDGAGTEVMTTWLLWAEVAPGLEFTWEVANPAIPSDASEY